MVCSCTCKHKHTNTREYSCSHILRKPPKQIFFTLLGCETHNRDSQRQITNPVHIFLTIWNYLWAMTQQWAYTQFYAWMVLATSVFQAFIQVLSLKTTMPGAPKTKPSLLRGSRVQKLVELEMKLENLKKKPAQCCTIIVLINSVSIQSPNKQMVGAVYLGSADALSSLAWKCFVRGIAL